VANLSCTKNVLAPVSGLSAAGGTVQVVSPTAAACIYVWELVTGNRSSYAKVQRSGTATLTYRAGASVSIEALVSCTVAVTVT
jgi:hypothetical protein